ncbi:MAG: GNAT family N-acetyltransferase [Chloroflexi bacterium]|nr:GNAT family N-acetyltransferase [Chloroflexota bacterium]
MVEWLTMGRRQGLRGLRPFNPARDLGTLADLIEVAFAEDLSFGGSSTVDEIRSLRWMGPLVGLLGITSSLFRDLFAGYVWVENGKVVGNVTISQSRNYANEWIISNLAVYPQYRQKGIARHLMGAAIEHALKREADWISLLVRSDNAPAKALYRKFGFQILDTFSEMHVRYLSPPSASTPEPDYTITDPDRNRWEDVYTLEKLVVTPSLQQMRPLDPDESITRWAPGWLSRAGEILQGGWSRRRWVQQGRELVAAANLTLSLGSDSHIASFLIHPDHRGSVEHLLAAILVQLTAHAPHRYVVANVSTNYPHLIKELEEIGFKVIRELDIMGAPMQH